jgi:site-specific recombinase XerD
MGAVRCRALTELEVGQVAQALERTRDRALFILGTYTGFRISELCSVKVKDVVQYGKVKGEIVVQKKNMKGKKASRIVVLHDEVRAAIERLLSETPLKHEDFLFQSREGDGGVSENQMRFILRNVFDKLQLQGPLSTHSMRKTFAKRVYEATGKDLYLTCEVLGHASISSTAKYLDVTDNDKKNVVINLPKISNIR